MFGRIATALVEESVTATSGLPSPLKSPTATPQGPELLPVLKVVAAENVPLPLFRSTPIVLLALLVTTTSA